MVSKKVENEIPGGQPNSQSEINRLVIELEKMREFSRITNEKSLLMSEQIAKLNVKIGSPSKNVAVPKKLPEIQILIESDENTLRKSQQKKSLTKLQLF